MVFTLQLRQLDVPLGQRLLVHHLNWPDLETILTELVDKNWEFGRKNWASVRHFSDGFQDRYVLI